jgi:exopolysaccharide biosynthesis polyprenyl glycosylphosphotransferase
MGLTLALLDAVFFVAVMAVSLFAWGRMTADWATIVGALGQAGGLALWCVAAFYLNDLYDLRAVRTLGEFGPRLIQSIGVLFLLFAVLHTVTPELVIGGRPFLVGVPIVALLLVVVRTVIYQVIKAPPFAERVLLVGVSPLTNQLIELSDAAPEHRLAIVGVADDATDGDIGEPRFPLLGPLARLEKIIYEIRPDRIVIGMRERRGRLPIRELLEARVRGVLVEDAVQAYERITGKLAIESLTPSALIFSRDFRKSRLDQAITRLASLFVSVVGLVLLAPVFALVALAVRLDSAGPIFFVQERVGWYGRRFRLIKFRTMRPAPTLTSEWAGDNCARITRVGRLLRKYRLDELPQFVNILRGEMNLVGPRPHPLSNVELFSERIPYYSLRSLVRPGVTGWAQVRYGYADNLEEEIEKMRYDLYYIKHFSLWFDIMVIAETCRLVLFGRGSK